MVDCDNMIMMTGVIEEKSYRKQVLSNVFVVYQRKDSQHSKSGSLLAMVFNQLIRILFNLYSIYKTSSKFSNSDFDRRMKVWPQQGTNMHNSRWIRANVRSLAQ